MSEVSGFDLDRNTAQAWSRFQARLADRIAEMTDEDTLVIDTEVADEDVDGAVPYVQFACFGDGTMVRGEVSGNAYLAARYELSAEQCERMSALGWHPPTAADGASEGQGSANFFLDVPVSEADRLAVMSVKALREVFGVPHPAFLAAGGLAEPAEEAAATPMPAVAVDPDEPLATVPESVEHLRRLVDAALTPLFDGPPAKDDDGDIPVPYGSSLVYVRVEEDTPIINLFSTVARGVTHLDRAAFEVNVLNRDLRFLKFFLVEDRVVAQIHVPASPFVPEHLRSMLSGMSQWLDDIDEDLVGRVGGSRAFDPAEGSDDELDVDPAELDGDPAEQGEARDATEVPSERTRVSPDIALQTLLQLDADESGSVDPELAANVCGYDQELIVGLLRRTEEQGSAWRKSRDRALLDEDTVEAGACERELTAWEQTTSLLRRALRVVVERAMGRETSSGPSHPGSGRPPAHMAPRPRRPSGRPPRNRR